MEIIIHPYQGIEIPGKGRIFFGMTRKRVRSFFKETPEELLIGDSDIPTDSYYEVNLKFFYKKPDILRSIVIASDLDPILQDKHLLITPYQQIEAWFKKIDSNLKIEDHEGLTSYKFGIGFWAPDADEDESEYLAESIYIFEKNFEEN